MRGGRNDEKDEVDALRGLLAVLECCVEADEVVRGRRRGGGGPRLCWTATAVGGVALRSAVEAV
jgi:hypothetical protein